MSLPFPNVPMALGVPQVPRNPAQAFSDLTALATQQQGTLWQSAQSPAVWGLFDQDGNAVLEADSITAFDNNNNWDIPTFPIQGGKLATFNKVLLPFDVTMKFRVTGTVSERNGFLIELDAIADDLNLYNVVTPEWNYLNVNVIGYGNPRPSAEMANAIEVPVYLRQIIPGSAQYSTTQSNTTNAQPASAAPITNQGQVSPQPIDPQTEATAQPALEFE